jgi:hypothetical protein
MGLQNMLAPTVKSRYRGTSLTLKKVAVGNGRTDPKMPLKILKSMKKKTFKRGRRRKKSSEIPAKNDDLATCLVHAALSRLKRRL